MAGVADPLQVQIDALNKRIDELDRVGIERLASVKENVSNALAAADKAVNKAESASEKRFESVNEFRQALVDQNSNFVRQSEYSLGHTSLMQRVDALSNQFIATDTLVRARMAASLSGPALFVSLSGVIILMMISIIAGAINFGIDKDRIETIKSTTDHLVDRERTQDQASSRHEVQIETIKTRQQINEERIKRLEK